MKVKSKVMLANRGGVFAPWLVGEVESNENGMLLIRFDKELNYNPEMHPRTPFPIRHYAKLEDVIILEDYTIMKFDKEVN